MLRMGKFPERRYEMNDFRRFSQAEIQRSGGLVALVISRLLKLEGS